ncbi:uncharacterized protein LOC127264219 [Andrographis paniculata]|uniref:uncharacterized protein LOC127264219 n=1 Tax=Andrographis paniculata TaxID=175694 RepID=UPI0021E94531|nr:uncharacterized protein LOC127264219 [Andrographis paniculata]
MDASAPTTASTPAVNTDSVDYSPRFRQNDSCNADPLAASKVRLMCSYGGRIVPRPHDKTLRYIGGDTRIIVFDRRTCLSDLHARLSRNLLNNQPFLLKYQLPNEDLDSLISLSTDEDLENLLDEYDRLNNAGGVQKRGRVRLFLFPKSQSGIEQVLRETSSPKSEDWFFDTLNGKTSLSATVSDRGFSESSSVNCLLGLDDDLVAKAAVEEKVVEAKTDGAKIGGTGNEIVNGSNHDVRSIPDSPMLGTTSSLDSTPSSPSASDSQPTVPQAEENSNAGVGIEEQFQQMSVGVGDNVNLSSPQKQEKLSDSTAAGVTTGNADFVLPAVVADEQTTPVVSDDEKSDHGAHLKVQHSQPQVQSQLQPPQIPQTLPQPTTGFDTFPPDSVSSEGNGRNPWSQQAIYQEQLKQIKPGNPTISSNQPDTNSGDQNNCNNIQRQSQPHEAGYISSSQFDQNHPQLHQNHPQFIPTGNHFIPAGAMPILSYYPIYSPQQQRNPPQPYPVFILPGNPNQPYNLSLQQPNYSELPQTTPCCPQTPPSAMASHTAFSQGTNAPAPNPEMASGMYQPGAAQFLQVAPGQHQMQYIAFAPVPHPQSVAPSSSAANSSHDFSDPAHMPMYYRPFLAAQYPAITTSPAMIIPEDTSSQRASENSNSQA